MPDYSRREFLRTSALAAAALSLAPLDACAARAADLDRGIVRRGPTQRIIIVGAGLAGLVAADELVRAGHDVLVLEARTYAGGRVHTIREPFADGLHAEAGAARIPDHHDLTLGYAKRFGLELECFAPDAPAVVYAGGRRAVPRPSEPLPPGFTDEERRLGVKGMADKYLGGPLAELGDFTAPDWPPESLRRYDAVTGTEWLRSLGASEAAIALFDLGNGLVDVGSLLDGMVELANEAREKNPRVKIRGGNDELPRAFAHRLGDRIHYGSPVVRIEQDDAGVRAVVERGGRRDVASADRMLVTVPFTVLRRMDVQPAWSPAKRRAIDELHYDSVSRVFLQTRTRYWERARESGFALTDHPMELFDASYRQPGTRGILMTYARDRLARQLTTMSEEERIRWALETVEPVYPGLAANFDGAVTKCWEEDPWARGAYVVATPGQIFAHHREIPRPEGRIHFAGEHASPWRGWMQGALWSGRRAAREISEVRVAG